ncbi:MAG: S9 family peptidase [Bacteroidales bacterium]|nr:S9 family peptidase [Bacteroidales bacterium]
MMKPPVAKIIEEKLISPHGDIRIDKYFWLNKRDDPEVMKALETENAYTDLVMAHTEEFQTQLYDEIVGRIKKDDSSVPYKKDGFYYYSRYEKEKEYPFYCRKKESMDNPEDVMLDVNKMAEGFSFYNVGGMAVSTNNSLLAYSVDTVSRRKYSIYFKDLETGEILEDVIPNTSGSITWANDNKTIFYVVKHEETLLPYKVYNHKLGTDISEDKLVYEEKDNTFSTSCYKTKSKRYILISLSSTLTTEFRFLDADHPDGDFRIIYPRERDLEYYIDHFKEHFYIRTNFEAKNFRLMKTPVNKTGKSNWAEVIPHRSDVLLQDFEIFSDFLVLSEKKHGLSQLRVKAWQGDNDYYIGFAEETYDSWISINPDFNSKVLRYVYTSLTTPRSTYDFEMFTRERSLLKRDEVVGDFDPSNYEAKRLFAVAGDGTSVPVSIVFRKGIKRDGNNPLWITGYGSYGYSYDPCFSSVRLSLLDRGVIFAIAHIRGGQEMGRSWYEDGKLLKKKNTFTDFIDCVEFLIKESYTNPEKVFASGGSAGGLLMGAVANMRPELFRGIIADVPFVDVVTTMLDESIPLTTGEYDEWGNPNDKEYYDYMKSYSPYENVQAMAYPAMLVTTGYHDSQVQYWEPARWVAKLREVKTDEHLLIFKIHIDYGHGGASGRFQKYKEVALAYAFVLDQLEG